jgi:SAM-dependent methyltransferase
MYRCPECGAGFAWPTPQKDALESYYANDYRGEDSTDRIEGGESSPWSTFWARARAQARLVANFHRGPLSSWLDIGAGYGYLLDEAARLGCARTAAVEPDRHARERLERSRHQVFESIAEAGQGWSVISISHVLEHVPEPLAFLGACRAALADNGTLFCEVPQVGGARCAKAKNDSPHLLFFEEKALGRLFEKAGFAAVDVFPCGERKASIHDFSRKVFRRFLSTPPPWFDRLTHRVYGKGGGEKAPWLRALGRSSG